MPTVIPGRDVSQAELAAIFGVSAVTIRTWEAKGCPVLERGGKGRPSSYNTADVIAWRELQAALGASGDNSAVDYAEARRRKVVAEAVIAEAEADLRSGEVVMIADVVTAIVAEYGLVRNKLLSIGARIAPRLAAARSASEVKSLVDAEVTAALTELTADSTWLERAELDAKE